MTEVYRDCINALTNRAGCARIQVRVGRLAHGTLGQRRVLTNGVCELKIDLGPGESVGASRNGKDRDQALHQDEDRSLRRSGAIAYS